jgi:hypothetical protein
VSQIIYDKLKQKKKPICSFFTYSILKSIEFSSSNRSNNDQTNNVPKKSLEVLLLEKNRALQSEQTQMKIAHADLESRLRQNYHKVNIIIRFIPSRHLIRKRFCCYIY